MPDNKSNPFFGLDYKVTMPAGFIESTSGNDLCWSMLDNDRRLKVYLDYADTSRRETNLESPRFSVHQTNEDGDSIAADGTETNGSPDYALLNSDDWSEVEKFISNHDPELILTTAP